MKRLLHSLCLSFLFVTTAAAQSDPPHVLIVSIDGLRPDCMLRAETPNLRKLMNVGSFSMWARTTDIAITTPSHTSMLTGVTPEKHGIDFNGDPPEDAKIRVPTLFDLAKAQGYTTGMASGKRKFTLFAMSGHLDHIWTPQESAVDDASTAKHAVAIITQYKPDVMYVHFAATDSTGHAIGWGTPDQLQTISLADRALGQVLDAYRDIGLLESTFIIISADHGGTVRSHGRDDIRSHFIPWIAVGPGVRSDYDLTRLGKDYDLSTFDTFATACHVLKIPLPPDLDGQPVLEMFVDAELLQPAAPPTTAPSTPTTAPTEPTTAPTELTTAPATQPTASTTQPGTDPAATQPAPWSRGEDDIKMQWLE